MDVVYVVKHDPENDSEELRYSLRSLKNIPHNRVFIVGELPSWVKDATHISVPQVGTKAQNVTANLRAIAASPDISNDFIFMNDDMFFMKPIDELPMLNFGAMNDVITLYDERYPEGSDYITSMKLLYQFLCEQGITNPISYELHTPIVINKEKAGRILNSSHRLYQFRSYYGNIYKLGGKQVADVKVFLDPRHNDHQFNISPQRYLQAQQFLSLTGGAFKKGIAGDFIRDQFIAASQYER